MIKNKLPRIVFAGDKEIAVKILKFLIKNGCLPYTLMVVEKEQLSYADRLIKLCTHLKKTNILIGKQFQSKEGLKLLRNLDPDYIICVHFPYIIPKEVLSIPKIGVLNLHPAYLPYNRGWHTPTWAIWDKTPYGATLHFMDEGVDTGDIIYQKQLPIFPTDTADTLYKRVLDLEYKVFKESWSKLVTGTYDKKAQTEESGTFHRKKDIESIQQINITGKINAEDFIRRIRSLTTNNIGEAAYFKNKNKTYRIQIKITEEKIDKLIS